MNDLIRAALALLLLVSCASAKGFTIPDVQQELEDLRKTESDLKGKVASLGAAYLDDLISTVERRVRLELRLETLERIAAERPDRYRAFEESSRIVKDADEMEEQNSKIKSKFRKLPRGGPVWSVPRR